MIGVADLRLTLVVFSLSPNVRPAKPDFSRRGAEYSGGLSPRQQGFLAYFSVICSATGPVSSVGLLRRTISEEADLILLVPPLLRSPRPAGAEPPPPLEKVPRFHGPDRQRYYAFCS